jgi:tetratricopeptide (TPR) repeat protein
MFATLAFRRLHRSVREGVFARVGAGAEPGTNGTAAHPDRQLAGALTEAAGRVWTVVEIALAGEALCRRLQHEQAPSELAKGLADTVCDFLDVLPADEFRDPAWCRRCLDDLGKARQTGLLADDGVALTEVTRLSSFVDRFTNPQKPEESEWGILAELGDEFEHAGLYTLKTVLGLRCADGEPFVVRTVHALVRHALERGRSPSRDWFGGQTVKPEDPVTEALDRVADMLSHHAAALETLLRQPDQADAPAPEPGPPPGAPPLQLGMLCYNRGQFDEAVAHFTAAIQLSPADAQAYAFRGDAHRLRCDYDRAVADYDRAIELTPDVAALHVNRGVIHELRHDTAAAVADFSAALRLDPTSVAAYFNRGKLHVAQGEHAMALADLSEALRLDPKSFCANYYRGQAYLAQANYTEAVADFTQVLKYNPRHTLAYTYRGQARYLHHDYQRALEDLTMAVRLHPQNVVAYVTRGHVHRMRDDRVRAVRDYSRALRFDPENAEVHRSRGIVLRLEGDRDRALVDLNQAVRLNPRDAEAFYHRGQTYAAMGRYEQAMLDFSQALRLDPHCTLAYLGRALLYERQTRFRHVIRDCTQALRIQPNLAAAHYIRGTAYLSQGKYAQAVVELSHTIRLDPQFALVYNDRGLAYVQLGKLDAALAEFQQAIELDPENPLAHANRGIVQQLRGVETEAWQDLVRGLQLSPQLVLSSWTRGWGSATREAYAQTIADYIEGRHALEVRTKDVVPTPEDEARDHFAELDGAAAPPPTRVVELRRTDVRRRRATRERPARATDIMPGLQTREQPAVAPTHEQPAAPPAQPVAAALPEPPAEAAPAAPQPDFDPNQELQCPDCAKVFRWKVVTARPDGRIRCPYCAALALPQPVGAAPKAKEEKRKRREPREPWEFNLSIPRSVWVAAAAVLLACGVYYFAFVRVSANTPVYIQAVTAPDLWTQMETTPEAAAEKYVGHQIAVTGIVQEIRDPKADTPVLVLKAGDKKGAIIDCTVKVKGDIVKVRPQMRVTVTGDCQPHAAGQGPVQMTNCRVSPSLADLDV